MPERTAQQRYAKMHLLLEVLELPHDFVIPSRAKLQSKKIWNDLKERIRAISNMTFTRIEHFYKAESDMHAQNLLFVNAEQQRQKQQ